MLLCVTTISTSAKNSQRITCERDIMTSKLKKASPIQEELTTSISQIRKLCNPCGKEKREMAHALPAIIPPPSLLPSRITGQALSPDRAHAPPGIKKQAPQVLPLPQRSRFSMNTLHINQGAQRAGTCPATGCLHSFILHRSSFAHLNLLPQFHHGHVSTVRTFPSLL